LGTFGFPYVWELNTRYEVKREKARARVLLIKQGVKLESLPSEGDEKKVERKLKGEDRKGLG